MEQHTSHVEYHTFNDFQNPNALPGILVPQEVYRAAQAYTRRGNIQFVDRGRLGVRLSDALANNSNLEYATSIPNLTDAHRASIRLIVRHSALRKCSDTDSVPSGRDMNLGTTRPTL